MGIGLRPRSRFFPSHSRRHRGPCRILGPSSSSAPPPLAVLEFSIMRSSASAEGENALGVADDEEEEATPSPARRQQLVTQELFSVAAGPPRSVPQPGAELRLLRPEPPRPQPNIRILPLPQVKSLSKEEFMHVLRRQSIGFSRGSSEYRGITLHRCGRWEARMGQFLGKKYIYLGLFDSEVEAARF